MLSSLVKLQNKCRFVLIKIIFMRKSILLCLFSLLFLCANAQVIPKENAGLESLKTQQDLIILNLDKHHKEYKFGWLMQLGGVLLSTIAVSTPSTEDDILSFYGGLISIAGGILVLDSDKWFSRKNIHPDSQYNKMQLELKQLRKQVSQVSRKLETPSEVTEEVINTPEPIVVKEIKLKPGLYYNGVKCKIIEKSTDKVRIKYLNETGRAFDKKWVNETELITVF
tara:strand:+ start:7375 stop:8049 length:675 start_codon:yes stop_codon:yes gene_type:complete